MTDLIIKFAKDHTLPNWLALVFLFLISLVKSVPYFEYRYKVWKDKRSEEKQNFLEAKNAMGDLNIKLAQFLDCLSKLKKDINSKKVSEKAIIDATKVFDSFFDDLNTICEGIDRGFILRSDSIQNIVNCVVKHKHDMKDNLITDTYDAVSNGFSLLGKPQIGSLRISTRYGRIFKIYRCSFSFFTRGKGLLDEKVFDIN